MKTGLIADFKKTFSATVQIHGQLRTPAQDFSVTVLFGPSGCGKTTILRCLAGLERPGVGRIEMNGRIWFDDARRVDLRPQERGIGFLFQDYALFPHLNVEDNIAYGLQGSSPSERRARVGELLSAFQIADTFGRYPRELSGGQQQRVALARALAHRPQLLLLDEPLSALDAPSREILRGELRRWLVSFRTPAIVVTHDRAEALAIADDIVVMSDGEVQQHGSVGEVFAKPANLAVARIAGVETVVPGQVIGIDAGLATILVVGGVAVVAVAGSVRLGSNVFVCVRGEDILIQRSSPEKMSARNALAGKITRLTPEGPMTRVSIACGFDLTALVTRLAAEDLALREGDTVVAIAKAPSLHLIERS